MESRSFKNKKDFPAASESRNVIKCALFSTTKYSNNTPFFASASRITFDSTGGTNQSLLPWNRKIGGSSGLTCVTGDAFAYLSGYLPLVPPSRLTSNLLSGGSLVKSHGRLLRQLLLDEANPL